MSEIFPNSSRKFSSNASPYCKVHPNTLPPNCNTKKRCNNKKLFKQTKQTPKSVIYFHLYFYIFILSYFSVSILILPKPPTPQPTEPALLAQKRTLHKHQKILSKCHFSFTQKNCRPRPFAVSFSAHFFCAIFVCSGKMTRKHSRVRSLHFTVCVSTSSI